MLMWERDIGGQWDESGGGLAFAAEYGHFKCMKDAITMDIH